MTSETTSPLNPVLPFVALVGFAAIYVVAGYAGYMQWATSFLLANVFIAAAIVYAGVWRYVEDHVVTVPAHVMPQTIDEEPVDALDDVPETDPELVVLSSKDP